MIPAACANLHWVLAVTADHWSKSDTNIALHISVSGCAVPFCRFCWTTATVRVRLCWQLAPCCWYLASGSLLLAPSIWLLVGSLVAFTLQIPCCSLCVFSCSYYITAECTTVVAWSVKHVLHIVWSQRQWFVCYKNVVIGKEKEEEVCSASFDCWTSSLWILSQVLPTVQKLSRSLF